MANNNQGQQNVNEQEDSITSEVNKRKSNSDKKESTRSWIALIYVIGFYVITVTVIILGWCKDFDIQNYKDMLVTISGILSGPLGFIVGYYFKASNE